jgi:hypothetical protein
MPATERICPMIETTDDLEPFVEESLIHQISDEALEAAATKDARAAFTLGGCTALSVCVG